MARPAREPSPRRGSPDADPALGRGIAAACAADAVSQGALYLVVSRLQRCVLAGLTTGTPIFQNILD